MKPDWMGRYRPLVRALVQHTNTASRNAGQKKEFAPGVMLSSQEWQVLEYLIEHEDEDENMLYISERLGIAQSSLSKYTKTLCCEKLVERYHILGNRKSIILKATDKGRQVYDYRSDHVNPALFAPLFEGLDSLPDEVILQVSQAIEAFNIRHWHSKQKTLVPIQEDNE
ncbi:MAG: winged helix-turn-helix transcriptional regulator [Clostridia bacterium]|nr:winged helix-turn-helix transcriptional regulator [Clostridia bacterium]